MAFYKKDKKGNKLNITSTYILSSSHLFCNPPVPYMKISALNNNINISCI